MVMDRGTLACLPAHDHDLEFAVLIDEVAGISFLGKKSVRFNRLSREKKPVQDILHSRRIDHGPVALQNVHELGQTNLSAHPSTFPLHQFLAWGQLNEFREIRIHVVPRLSARCVNIRLGPIPARVVQAPYHDTDDPAPCGGLAKQPSAASRAETTLYDAAAVAGHIVVFYLSGDAHHARRDKQCWSVGTPRRSLAITAMAIHQCDWISRTFIAYASADTTASKTGGHQFSSCIMG